MEMFGYVTVVLLSAPQANVQEVELAQASHGLPAENRILSVLPALGVRRATYKLRRRTMKVNGGLRSTGAVEAIEATLAASAAPNAKLEEVWWDWWSKTTQSLRASVVTTDETYEVSSQPTRFKRRYLDLMPNIDLTERPLVDLYTSQHHTRITFDKRSGIVVHLSPRMNTLLQTPSSILSPLPTSARKIEVLRNWAWSAAQPGSEMDRHTCRPPEGRKSSYDFWLGKERYLPAAALLNSGSAQIGAVFKWKSFSGVVWASTVGKVRKAPGQCFVELLEISTFSVRPKNLDVKLRSSLPVELLDHRFGDSQYQKFNFNLLPKDVKDAYTIR